MNKRLFQILDEMNLQDGENGTATVAISNSLVEANKCKQGGLVTMGCDSERFHNIVLNEKRYVPLLVVVDMDAYNKIKSQK